jgi:hypothetical protein
MKAKVIQDGSRVVITLTGIENPEEFVDKVVKIASGVAENEVVPQKVEGLAPVIEEETESYDGIIDFAAPYTGKTPAEIAKLPKSEGLYFLCRSEIPERYKEECNQYLYEWAEKNKFFTPPYGDISRMKKYLLFADKVLGDLQSKEMLQALGNEPFDEMRLDALKTMCEAADEKVQAFFAEKAPKS